MKMSEHIAHCEADEVIQRLTASKDWLTFVEYVNEAIANKREAMGQAIADLEIMDDPETRKAYFDFRAQIQALTKLISIPGELRALVSENKRILAEKGASVFEPEFTDGPDTPGDTPSALSEQKQE